MPETKKRRLAAILFADLQGYTAVMQKDENRASRLLRRFQDEMEAKVAEHQGRIVNFYGDGSLCVFDTPLDAVQCARDLQLNFSAEPQVPVRLGLHTGTVVFEGEKVYGDSINIASRIESLGVPGAVLLSKKVKDEIHNHPEFKVQSLGKFNFKNVEQKLEVFALANEGLIVPSRRSLSGKTQKPQRNLAAMVLLGVVLIFSLFAWQNYLSKNGGSSADGPTIPKLAVLAFENEGDYGDEYFSRGITEELNSRLSGLRNLAVISRSSAKMFSNSDLSAKEIGEKLGADYILEGSVQWNKPSVGQPEVRIRPRLVKVKDDTQLWSPSYKRVLNQANDVQSQIALELIKELNLALSTDEEFRLNEKPTGNPLAYQAWLRGLEVQPEGHGSKEDYQKAYDLFKQAVTLDSEFARAWVSLAHAHKSFYWFGYDTRPTRLDSAQLCMEKAASINPDLHEVALGQGDYHYRLRQFDQALIVYSKLMEERPNDPELLRLIAYIWRRQGLIEQAMETMEKASTLDPLSVMSHIELAWTSIFVNDYDKAIKHREIALELDPKGEWNYLIGAYIYWNRAQEGDLQRAKELLQKVPVAESAYPAWFWITQHLFEGDTQAALNKVNNLTVPAVEMQSYYAPKSLMAAKCYQLLGESQKAKVKFTTALTEMKNTVEEFPDDFRMHLALGKAYAGLGQKEEAMKAGEKGAELMSLSRDALMSLDALHSLMQVYAMVGEDEKAIDVMAKMHSVPCPYRGMFFTHDPTFASLQNNPRFQELVTRFNTAPRLLD